MAHMYDMSTQVVYSIQNNIDFYAEINNDSDSDVEECIQSTAGYSNKCLITTLPLTENHVVLRCGHAFNYDPIFKDVYYHKKKFQNLESRRIGDGEIRCPYCRSIQQNLLPNIAGKPIIYGINTLNLEELVRSGYMSKPALYSTHFQKYSYGRCCNGIHASQVKDGLFEYMVTCNTNNVKYEPLSSLVFCPDHFVENVHKRVTDECEKHEGLIDIMNEYIKTVKGAERQRIKTRLNMIRLMHNNFTSYLETVKCAEAANKIEVDCEGYKCNNHEMKPSGDKYTKYPQCFAYLISGKSKDEQCKLEVYEKGCMYCSKHTKLIADIVNSCANL